MIAPVIDKKLSTLEVKAPAENQWANDVQHQLQGTVFSAGCSNWYINKMGRNSASWPGYASTYWKETLIPRPSDFIKTYSSRLWWVNTIKRWFLTSRKTTFGVLAALVAIVVLSGETATLGQLNLVARSGLRYCKLATSSIHL